MSKIEELINELCPNGVEYKRLIDLGKFYGGLTGKSKEDFKFAHASESSSVGRAQASQAWGRGFESRFSLFEHQAFTGIIIQFVFCRN